MNRHDIRQLSDMLSQKAESVCEWLLPQGKREGKEWRVGSVEGNTGHSLGVNLCGKPGVWRDFADDTGGGDLIDLIQAVKGVSKAQAVALAKDFLGLKDDTAFEPKKSGRAYQRPKKPTGLTVPGQEMLRWFELRGISRETVEAFKIGQLNHEKKGPVIVFPYLVDNELFFMKYRPLHDKKGMWTSKDSEPCLFGWHIMPENARTLVIVEGELDAMAFYQGGVCAVSVPRGGGDGNKQDAWIDAEWDRLQLFDTIYLALDNDEPGQRAAAHIARRLGQHRCFLVDLGPHKDANEALLANMNLNTLFETARTIDPAELRQAISYHSDVFDYFINGEEVSGTPLPWYKVKHLLGLRHGEISIWAGINGHGKSQVMGHIVVDSIARGERWCVASMEFKPRKLLARMYRQASARSQPSLSSDGEALLEYFADRLWMFDVQGTAKADRILEVFGYAYRRYGVRQFLIDSLAKCGFGEDAYNEQKAFVDSLSDFARNNDVHVHLVCHSRKRDDETKQPDKFDIKGTGALTDMVDNVFIIWRNKAKEKKIQEAVTDQSREHARSEEPDAIVACCKQRNAEWEGRIKLWFDPASLQYLESSNGHPRRYCRAATTERT